MELGVTEISAIVAAAGVLVGVAYYILDMRNQARMRQTDMVMRSYSTFGSPEFQKEYQLVMNLTFKNAEDYLQKYGMKPEIVAALYTVTVFFEGLGLLVKRRLTSIDLMEDILSGPVQTTWEKIGILVVALRARSGRSSAGEWFEYLYNEMKKREQAGVKNG
jgi:hypothetical protein